MAGGLAGAFVGMACGAFVETAGGAEPAVPFAEVRGWLTRHCLKCHAGEVKEGQVDLGVFKDEMSVRKDRKLWNRVLTQIDTLEMPPADEAPLPGPLREAWTGWIKHTLARTDGVKPWPGRSVVRRLSRTQYDRTVFDLTGVRFHSASEVGMPDDFSTNAFDHFADALTLPAELLEKYFSAADKIVTRLVAKPPDPKKKRPADKPPTEAELAWERVFVAVPGPELPEREAAKRVLERFARRAYRRPVAAKDIDRLLAIYDHAERQQLPYLERVAWGLKAVLVSPHFLLRTETDRAPAGSNAVYTVDDHELAVRLSYFLWASMPDEALFAAAETGKLHEPAELEAQVRRMLADPKAEALTTVFAAQWLQLGKLADARPAVEFFPSFNHKLRQSMHDEVTAFVRNLRTEDRPLDDLLDADYTFVSKELARHYKLPIAQDATFKDNEIRRVSLRPEDHRGGVLGMGAVLAMTSHTSRTSPTLRGKWVLEALFGAPPPPPPANVGQVDEKQEPGKEPKTFREQLAKHAHQKSCAGCHAKIDPLGFGLENFDAVGAWRDKIAVGGKPFVPDVSGKLPTGEAFVGFGGLKGLLKGQRDVFLRNAVEQTLSYALGRPLEYYDEPAVAKLLAEVKAGDAKFSVLILGTVRSYPFLNRCNVDATE